MSNGAGCSSTGKETHEHGLANEQEDHDSTIYVPNGCFPALEGNTIVKVYIGIYNVSIILNFPSPKTLIY